MLQNLSQHISTENIDLVEVFKCVDIAYATITDAPPQAQWKIDGESTFVSERPSKEIAQKAEFFEHIWLLRARVEHEAIHTWLHASCIVSSRNEQG